METLLMDLLDELRVLDNRFAETYQKIIPGKLGILFEAESLLARGRLPLAETGPDRFPASSSGEYRTLSFAPRESGNPVDVAYSLYGGNVKVRTVVDVSIHDGDAFFDELSRYFRDNDPISRLREIQEGAERYRAVLLENFTLEDVIGDMTKVRKHYSWAPRS